MVILAALLSVAAASGSDARTAVDAFVARLGEVNVADLVIEQTLTLFDPGGRHPQSSGEQRVYVKLPRRRQNRRCQRGGAYVPSASTPQRSPTRS